MSACADQCKLFLVPAEVLETWQATQRAKAIAAPDDADGRRKDAEVRAVLDTAYEKNLSARDRATLLGQRTGEFLEAHRRQQKRAGQPVGQHAPVPGQQQQQQQQQPSPRPLTPLDSIPKTLRGKAQALLDAWSRDPDIEWDDQHRVTIRGSPVYGSNLIDLLGDAVRSRKTAPRPPGFSELRERSLQANVPRSLLGNAVWHDSPAPSYTVRKRPNQRPTLKRLQKPLSRPKLKRTPAAKLKKEVKEEEEEEDADDSDDADYATDAEGNASSGWSDPEESWESPAYDQEAFNTAIDENNADSPIITTPMRTRTVPARPSRLTSAWEDVP